MREPACQNFQQNQSKSIVGNAPARIRQTQNVIYLYFLFHISTKSQIISFNTDRTLETLSASSHPIDAI